MRRAVSLVLIGSAFGLGACSTTRGPDANLVRFQRTVGQATPSTARELAMRIITQYGFVVEREQPIPNLVIHTRWRERAPFADEEALGISHAQNRMVIMTRPRSSTNNQVTHSVDVSIENRVQLVGSEAWTDASATREYEKWASRIIEDFTRELNVGGVRR